MIQQADGSTLIGKVSETDMNWVTFVVLHAYFVHNLSYKKNIKKKKQEDTVPLNYQCMKSTLAFLNMPCMLSYTHLS